MAPGRVHLLPRPVTCALSALVLLFLRDGRVYVEKSKLLGH